MLDHIGIDVSDIDRSRAFYAAALAPLGYAMTKDLGTATGFGVASGERASADPGGEFWIAQGAPKMPLPHIAFNAGDRAAVDAFHAAALEAGGQDNGPPASASATTRSTTPPSSWTPTATTSRRSATAPREGAHRTRTSITWVFMKPEASPTARPRKAASPCVSVPSVRHAARERA